jgi:hypothetical protein
VRPQYVLGCLACIVTEETRSDAQFALVQMARKKIEEYRTSSYAYPTPLAHSRMKAESFDRTESSGGAQGKFDPAGKADVRCQMPA